MKSIKINQPTSLKDITLEQYQLWMEEIKGYQSKRKEEENLSATEIRQLDDKLRQRMVQIFCNTSLTAVRGMLRTDFTNISDQIAKMLEEKPPLKPVIELRGRKFGFIPDLQRDIRTGEYIDLDDFMKDWSTYHKAMGVLYRPILLGPDKHSRYTITEYNDLGEYDNIMRQLPMDVVMGAVVFFYRISRQLLEITPKYLQLLVKEKKELAQILETSGDGTSMFTHSLAEACSKLKMLQDYGSVKPYST